MHSIAGQSGVAKCDKKEVRGHRGVVMRLFCHAVVDSNTKFRAGKEAAEDAHNEEWCFTCGSTV